MEEGNTHVRAKVLSGYPPIECVAQRRRTKGVHKCKTLNFLILVYEVHSASYCFSSLTEGTLAWHVRSSHYFPVTYTGPLF